jgi:hypothetical protein
MAVYCKRRLIAKTAGSQAVCRTSEPAIRNGALQFGSTPQRVSREFTRPTLGDLLSLNEVRNGEAKHRRNHRFEENRSASGVGYRAAYVDAYPAPSSDVAGNGGRRRTEGRSRQCSDGQPFWSADLRQADLRGADLRRANMDHAKLGGADLRGADLAGASLWSADLHDADLRQANLQGAKLDHADLRGTRLGHANLREASLWGAHLECADFRGATGLTGTQLQPTFVDEKTRLPRKRLRALAPHRPPSVRLSRTS